MKYEETAKRIRNAMTNVGISQQCLADKSGVGKSSISHYVNGTNQPGNKTAYALAQVLKVDPAWLMGLDVPMEPAAPLSEIAPVQLRQDEEVLLSYYNRLNALGQSKVTEYAADLADSERYIKDDDSEELNKVG